MNKRFKENEEVAKSSTPKSMLSGLSAQQIKNITVVIRRPYIQEIDAPTIIQTSLDDLSTLAIHRKGEGEQPIFARKDILVNVEEHLEERIVSTSPDRNQEQHTSRRTRSSTQSDRGRSSESYRRSSSKESSISRSSSKRSKLKTTSKDDYSEKRHADVNRKKTVATDYQKSGKDYDRRSRDKSPKVGTSKSNRSPVKEADRKDSSRHDYRDTPPRRYDKTRSYSRSPKRSGYSKTTTHDKDKYVRRRSRSPSIRRRSRSPCSRKRTPSPHSSKRSRSPYVHRTPRRFARRSKSPYDEKKKYTSSSSYTPSYYKKRTPSPYSRRRSRSPYRGRKRSITPSNRDSRSHKRDRSKSPRSNTIEKQSTELTGYKGIHPDFGFYGADAYWIPGPIPRPGFIPRGMIPGPRGAFRPPYFIHRPYMPFPHPHPHPNYRPRFTVEYNRPSKPKTSSTTTATNADVEKAPLTVSTQATSTSPSIKEVESETNKVNVASTK